MLTRFLGPGLVLTFALSQAFRDVYFAGVFQGTDFFTVILIAFSTSALVFCAVTLIRDPWGLAGLRRELSAVFWMNVTTAVAWICYFFALKHLQPSIVNTLHSGAGPLTVIALSSLGIHFAKPSRISTAEYLCHAGLAGSLIFLWWVVLSGHSGLPLAHWRTSLTSLALLIVSGTSITISLLLSKRLNERGLGADAITAGRYLLIIIVALGVTLTDLHGSGIASLQQFQILLAATTVLIVFPLYSLQLGIAYTAPLTAQVIRSLGPVFVFALEFADGRIGYARLTLLGIVLYSIFSIAANLMHDWRRMEHGRRSAAAERV
jgi:drug/metabolite transporter (DMT)-like permease